MIDRKIVGKTNEDLRLALEAVNIESRPLWPMHLQPIFASYPYYGSDVAESYIAMDCVYRLVLI
jgi:hypothetical protein